MDATEASLACDVISFARKHTYYYRHLYQSILDDESFLEDLPITDLEDYWKMARADLANVLTTPLVGGRILCTGGSTSHLESIHLTLDETHNHSKAKALIWGSTLDLSEGDRLASLATTSDLHTGFWDTVNMYTGVMVPVKSIQILISNEQPLENIAAAVERFRPSILIGPPFDIVHLAEYFGTSDTVLLSVRAILYLGHSLPKRLHSSWHGVFPKAKLFPLMYSTKLDIGPVGLPAPITTCENCDVDPTYSVAHEIAILEIVTDDGTIIKQPGVKGNVIITHLLRRLQPIIRYPVGDVAEWVDYESRTFKYKGRVPAKIKLAEATLDISLVKEVVNNALGTNVDGRFQCVLCCEDSRPKLIIRLAYPIPHNPGQLRHNIESAIWKVSPGWKHDRLAGAILSIRLEWVDADELDHDESSGKVKELVDER
ncbi:hypothetical protein F4820DRAFT_43172 [Hypoxylon rubiginosum]|uniref:Uncharacterized protein n=1 Tax=Hypoxylon rubiginosum TaxID=110542 RepID=A0ACB9ZDA9_9PEZI|nr:hypothetical protein F4820DRAFT_43172 [Hypoxylon rubiginosum]